MLLFISCAGIVWALLWSRAAQTLQAVGDGCEMTMAAVRGSLVHPPGFPVYTTLNDVVAALTPGDPYAVLAKLQVLMQGAAVGVLGLAGLALGLPAVVAASCALLFGLSADALWSGVHVEVFPLHHLLSAVLVAAAFAASARAAPPARLVVLGGICGVAGAHQPIIVLWAPLVVGAIVIHLRSLAGLRVRVHALAAMGIAVLVGLTPYLTLPLRQARAPEIAFGSVHDASSLLGHMVRSGYGTFSFARATAAHSHAPTDLLLDVLVRNAPLTLVAVPIALVLLARRRDIVLLAALGACVLHVVFVSQLVVVDDPATHEIARRFFPSVVMSFVVLLAVVARVLRDDVRFRALFVIAALGPVGLALPSSLARANAADDHLPASYIAELMRELPEGAVFFADSDVDAFCVLDQQHAFGVRPDVTTIVVGRLESRWYREDLETLAPFGRTLPFDDRMHAASWARAAHDAGRPLFSTQGMKAPDGFVARPVGVVVELFPVGTPIDDLDIMKRNVDACARWPDALAHVNPARASSMRLRETFLEAARVAGRAGRRASPEDADALERAVAAAERDDIDAARRTCAAVERAQVPPR